MKLINVKSLRWLGTLALLLTAWGTFSLADFTSTQVEYVAMEAQVGGTIDPENPLDGFVIKHVPLRGVSLVTRIALIQGTVGTNHVPANITVKLRLQILNTDGTPNGGVDEQVALFYSEPAPFLFQVSPSSLTTGGFRYQILAEKRDADGVLISTAAMPRDAFADPDLWISLNPQAGAGPVLGSSGGRVTLYDANPNDGESLLDVPPGVLKGPTQITLSEVPLNDQFVPGLNGSLEPYALYKLESDPPVSGHVRVSVIYPEFIPTPSGWQLGGTPVPQNRLSLAIWDGFSWKNIGGKIDALTKTISAKVGAFNYLGVFNMGPPSGQSIADSVQKIVTPNGDNSNDKAVFSGTGPGTQIEIFDMTGHRVRSLTGPNAEWDARNESSQIVESGVYIYQFSENGERVSGVIGVAK